MPVSRRGLFKLVGAGAAGAALSFSGGGPEGQPTRVEASNEQDGVAELARKNFDRLTVTGKETYANALQEAMGVQFLKFTEFDFNVGETNRPWDPQIVLMSGNVTTELGHAFMTLQTHVAPASFGTTAETLLLDRIDIANNLREGGVDCYAGVTSAHTRDGSLSMETTYGYKFGLATRNSQVGLVLVRENYAESTGKVAGYFIPLNNRVQVTDVQIAIGNDDVPDEPITAINGDRYSHLKKKDQIQAVVVDYK